MLNISRHGIAAVAVAIAMSAGPAAAKDTAADMQKLVDDSNTVLKTYMADKEMAGLRANASKAKAILISPEIVKAGFILGGSGGQAVLLTRGKDGKWAGPAAYTLRTANVGFQAGISESSMVGLIMTQKAVDKLMAGSFKLGSDVSIAAGSKGGGAATDLKADIISYGKSKGVYGGVNFSGTGVSPNDSYNAAYYGKSVTPTDILVTRSVPAPAGAKPLVNTVSTRK